MKRFKKQKKWNVEEINQLIRKRLMETKSCFVPGKTLK